MFSDTVNTGIYVLEPEVFRHIPSGRAFDFSKDLFPIYLRENVPIYGCNAPGYWRDVGDPDSYREAVHEILEGTVKLTYPGRPQERGGGTLWCEEGGELPDDLVVEGQSVVGKGVRLGRSVRLRNVVLGDGCRVGDGAVLEGANLWRNVSVGARSHLRNVVLCDGVRWATTFTWRRGPWSPRGPRWGTAPASRRTSWCGRTRRWRPGACCRRTWCGATSGRSPCSRGLRCRAAPTWSSRRSSQRSWGPPWDRCSRWDSHILVGRDYLRASRMLKRAFLGGILSTGVNVHDIKMAPVPVQRYKLASFGEVAGVYFQQSPAGSRNTEIVFYDGDGNLIDTGLEKSIERLFFKENFRRVDHGEVGAIREMPAVPEFYREGYLRALDLDAVRARRFRVVLDLGNGTTGEYLPSLLNALGCETVVLNTYPDERRLMRRTTEAAMAARQVGEIVKALGADLGFCVTPGGQNLELIDDRGRVRSHHETVMFVLRLLVLTNPSGVRAFLPVTAPRAVEGLDASLQVVRGKITSLKTSRMHEYAYLSEAEGKHAFPGFLHAPDAMFAVARILELLGKADRGVGDVFESLPRFAYLASELPCAVECKGLAMRKMSEDSVDKEASFVDGVQVRLDGSSVLLLPDPYRPVLHLVVEGEEAGEVERLAAAYREKVEGWIGG